MNINTYLKKYIKLEDCSFEKEGKNIRYLSYIIGIYNNEDPNLFSFNNLYNSIKMEKNFLNYPSICEIEYQPIDNYSMEE
jgi:hypothetical protein